jgi:protein-S-isoprenylcysteine O-methyltransferase Ste14
VYIKPPIGFRRYVSIAVTFSCVTLLWLPFAINDMHYLGVYLGKLVSFTASAHRINAGNALLLELAVIGAFAFPNSHEIALSGRRSAWLLPLAILLFAFPPRHHYYAPTQLWRSGDAMNWILVALTAAGLLFTWWARIQLGRLWSDWVVKKAGHHVVDTGPYRLVRHPIYSGLIFAAFATAIEKGTSFALLGVAFLTLAFYRKARREERFLRAELGENAYDAYARKTAMLVPFVRIES